MQAASAVARPGSLAGAQLRARCRWPPWAVPPPACRRRALAPRPAAQAAAGAMDGPGDDSAAKQQSVGAGKKKGGMAALFPQALHDPVCNRKLIALSTGTPCRPGQAPPIAAVRPAALAPGVRCRSHALARSAAFYLAATRCHLPACSPDAVVDRHPPARYLPAALHERCPAHEQHQGEPAP